MNDGIQALMEKSKESLSAAELLRDQGYHDFSASRAYYSMFYTAEALLASLGQSYSSHSGVISSFGYEFAKTGKLNKKYHRWLIDAQDMRNTGDYGIGQKISEVQSGELIFWAREFIQTAEEYFDAQKEK